LAASATALSQLALSVAKVILPDSSTPICGIADAPSPAAVVET
jgi:hypothetical protein